MRAEELKRLPKIELHCHLDGSLSKEFVETRLQRAVSFEELSVSDECTSLVEYLKKFDLPGQCLTDDNAVRFLVTVSIRLLSYFSPLPQIFRSESKRKYLF